MKLRFKSTIILVFLMIGTQLFAQVPFDSVPNSTLRINGELKIIGNAIVGLNQRLSNDNNCSSSYGPVYTPNDDYNGTCSNNQRIFGYIDIDGDPSTFSSSSADLILTSGCEKIAYAGLYWSASYFVQRNPNNNDYVQYTGLPLPDNRPDFRTIKIRPPGGSYITIPPSQTQVIYNGYRNTATNPSNRAADDIPYVCYADVTSIIQGLGTGNANGTYTVGDMRAATGHSGNNANGISGGWVLVVAYEDPNLSAKFISTNNGYLVIRPGGPLLPFQYTGFNTLPAPLPVRARYAIATLEGDRRFSGDEFEVQKPDNDWHPIFTTPANPDNNFYDSSISVNGQYVTTRNPASRNTLGFDADIFNIDNPSNTIIGNSQTTANFRTASAGDKYSVFFNSFQIEIIEPELTVKKRVLDVNGIDITGQPVNFADQLFYELTIENQGNEAITAASILDVLPANVDFTLGSITTSNPGIVATPNGTNREIDITIDDALIVRNGGVHTVRFGVSVVATCADLRDACSNEINNTAISTYTGIESGITKTGEESILDQDACQSDIIGSSNVLINNGICFTETQPAFICTGSLTLTAGAGFTRYEWVNANNPGVIIGTNRELVVTVAGTYIVTEFGAPTCQDSQQTFEVDAFNTIQHPVVDIVNGLDSNPNVNGNLRTCTVTGEELPEIFLCGTGTSLNIPINFPVGTTVVWERMDPAACPSVVRDPDCPTIDAACNGDWVQVSTDIGSYTVTQAGEYRIRATFDSNCTIPFYFNVFQNNFDPDLVVIRQIICGTPGTIRVQNSSNQYEYQLITPSGGTIAYQDLAEFTGLTAVGNYTVNVRQKGGLPTACVFQDAVFLDELDATETVTATSPTCPGDRGEISITVADSQINYTYIINSTTTAFTDTEGPTTIPSHVFTGLVPDTYEVQVLSADGSCSEVFTRTVNAIAPFSATIRLVEDLHCNPDYQPDINLADYDPDQFIAIYEVTVIGGSTNFSFNNQIDFLGTTLVPLTATTYQFRATTAGNYPVYVNDLDNSCTIFAGSVDVNPYTSIAATAAPTDPVCPTGTGSILVNITAGEGPFTYILDQGTANEVTIGPTVSTSETFNNVDTSISHVVTVQDQFGCDLQLPPINFTAPTAITANIALTQDYQCNATGSSVPAILGEITVSGASGGNGSYEYSIDGVDFTNTTGVFTGLTDGTYTLYIRDTNTAACPVNLGSITIEPLQVVTDLTFAQTQVQCPGLTSDITLTATGSNGAVPPTNFEYQITAPIVRPWQASNVFTGIPAGATYTFESRILRNGGASNACVYSERYTIDAIDAISVSASITAEPTCDTDPDASFTFTVTGIDLTSTTYSYDVSGGTIAGSLTGNTLTTVPVSIPGIGAGTYDIVVTDDTTLCTATTQVIITDPADLTIDPPTTTPAGCGINDGTITVTANGGRGGYQYELRNAAGTLPAIVAYQGTNSFTGLAPGTYTVFVRDGNTLAACEENIQAIVGEELAPVIVLATGGDACYDPINRATQWITITPGVAAPIGPFTYSLDGGAPVAVTFLSAPAPANTFEIPNLTPGAHTISVINTVSVCPSNTINFTINPELIITANLDKDIDCNSGAEISFTATGGDGSYTFNLLGPAPQSGITSPITGITTPGTYQIEVEDGLSCTAVSNTITINPYEALTGNLVPIDPACPTDNGGITVNTTAGEGPFTYILDGTITFGPTSNVSHTFNGVDATVPHNVVIRDRFNCDLALGPISLAPPATIAATINDDFRLLSCTATPGAQAQVTAITGGSGTYEWSLNAAGPFTAVAAIPFEIDFATAGSYTLYIRNEATDDCVQSFPITIDPLLEVDDITFVLGTSDCSVQTYEVTATAAPVGPTYTYSVVPAPVSGDATTGVFVLNRDVTYTFTATRGDSQCTYSEDYRQELVPEIQITNAVETSPTTCIAGSDGSLSFTVGNSANFTYTITGPIAVPSGSGTGVTPVAVGSLEAGVYTITVTDSNLAGGSPPNCQATTTVTITQPDPITFTIDPVDQDCAADTNTVTISGVAGGSGAGYTYVLSDSGGTAVGPSRPVNQPYNNVPNALGYQIVVTDGAGCPSAPQTLNINQLDQLNATVNTGSDFCLDDGAVSFTIDIDATNSGTPDYIYNVTRSGVVVIPDTNVGAATTFTTTPNLTIPGDYIITITDSNGCPVVLPTQTIAPAVELIATPVADITCDALGNPVDAEFSFVVNGGYTPFDIAVSFNSGAFTDHITNGIAPFANYTATSGAGSYVFRVTDDRGCAFTTTPFTVTDPDAPTITAPTVDLDCDGDTGTAVVNVTGTETPYEIDFQNTGTFVTITGTQISFPNLTANTYDFTVRSSRGCLTTGSVIINQPDPITATELLTPIRCSGTIGGGNTPGSILLTLAGGTPAADAASYTYILTRDGSVIAPPVPVSFPSADQVFFDGLVFGFYTIEVVDTNGCLTLVGSYQIENEIDSLSFVPTTVNGTCAGGFDLQVDIIQGSGIDPGPPRTVPGFRVEIIGDPGSVRNLGDDGAATPLPIRTTTYNGLAYGVVYTILATDLATQCTYQEQFTPTPPSEPIVTITSVTPSTCKDADNGQVTFEVSAYDSNGGTQSFTWEILNAFNGVVVETSPGSVPATGNPAPVSIGPVGTLAQGTYIVRVTEDLGTLCPGLSAEFTITEPTAVTATAGTPTPANSCGTNAQVVISTNGGTLFSIPPTADGYQYALIADDGGGSPITTPTVFADFPFTNNVIDLGNTNGQVQHIFVVDANECTFGPITVTTVVNPLPTVTAPPFVDDPCIYDNNYTFQVVGTGLGTLTYQLNGGTAVTGSIDNFNHVFTVSSAGTYTITITDETGCTNTDSIEVYDPLEIVAEFTTAPDCLNPTGVITTTLSGTSPAAAGTLSYILQDSGGTPTGNTTGAATGIFTGVAPGSYIVEVTDDGRGPAPGCPFTGPVSIEAPTLPILLAQPPTSVTCNGDADGVINAVLDPATEDATATYQYEITAGPATRPLQTSPQFTGLAAGTYTVRVTATEANVSLSVLCTDDQDYTIGDPTVVIATGTPQDPLTCGAGNTTSPGTIAITIDATTGTGPDYFVTVTQPDGVVRTRIPVPTPIPAPPATALLIDAPVDGAYNITVFDSNNCPVILPPVNVAPLPVMSDPTVTPGTPIDCVTNVQQVTVSITGGTGPFDFAETSGAVTTQTGIVAGTGDTAAPGVQTTATFNLPGVGNYVFEITDTATGCTIQTLPFDVPEYDTIEATITPSVNVACAGDATGEIILTVTGYPVAPVAPGTYDYQVTNTTTGTITNGTGDVGSGPLTITGLEAGEVVVVVTATQTPLCDATTNIVTISEPDALTLDALSISTPDCNNGLSVVTMDASGGVGPYNYAAEAGTLVPGPAPVTPGVFPLSDTFSLDPVTSLDWVIYVQDANGCITPRQIAIPPVTAPPTLDLIPEFVDDACDFDNNYTFTVTATSNVPAPGTGALTYQLNTVAPVAAVGPQVPGNVNNNTHQFTVTAPGRYRVFVYDENGCPSASQDITVYPELLVIATMTVPTCRDNDATIVATVSGGSDITANPGNFTFDLVDAGTGITVSGVTQTPGPGADQITFSSTVAGTDGIFPGDYRVEVIDSAIGLAPGCPANFDITVPTFLDPIPSGAPTPVSCFGGNDGTILVSLDPAADVDTPYQYQIVAGPETRPLQLDPLFENLPAGTYDIVVVSDKGCSNTPAIQVIVGGPTAALDVVPSQTAYGCSTSNVEVFPIITLTITDGTPDYDVSYTGAATGSETDVADADGGTAGVQYNVTATVAGTYTFTVTDNNNCAFANFDVIVPAFPIMTDPTVTRDTAAVNAGFISCDNPETVIVSITGGTGPFDFVEISGSGTPPVPSQLGVVAGTGNVDPPVGVQTTATFALPSIGNYKFKITDQGTGCFIETSEYTIAAFDDITVALTTLTDVLCAGATTGELSLNIGGYTGAYNYTVTNTGTGAVVVPSTAANTTTNPLTIGSLSGGTYQVSVEALDTPFCDEVSNTTTINQPTPILVTVNQIQDETCNPGDDATVEAVAAGGTGAFQYQLETSGGAILVPFGTDPRFGGLGLDAGVAPAGLDYVVRVRDANNCEATGNINIQPPAPIGLDPIAPTILACADSEDGVIVATATGGQGAGTYFFMLTFPDGSQSGRLSSTTDTYRWEDLKPGNYIVTVSDNLNCEIDQNPVIIDAPPAVTIDINPTGVSCLTANPNNIQVIPGGGTLVGYEFGVSSDNGVTITWQVSDTFLNLPEGDYDFYVRDSNLCESPASTRVQVRDPEPFVVTLDLNNTSIICFSQPTGSIDAVATGGLGNYMYSIAGTDYLGGVVTIGPQTTSFFGDLLAGNYTYTVTSGDCVDSVTPFTITQPLEFIIDVVETPISCNGDTDGSIRVFVEVITPPGSPGGTAPYFYSLYNSAGNAVYTFLEDDIDGITAEHTFIDLPADTYRVEVEDNNGCPREVTDIIIIEPEAIVATITATTPEDCAGDMNGTANVSITGGLPPANPADPSYFWSIDGVNYQPVLDPANLFIDNLPGGTTTLFIRDSQNNANCQGAFNIEIESGVNLGATLIPRLVCPVYDYTDPRNPIMTREEQYFVEFSIIDESRDLGIIYTLNGVNGTPNPANNSNLTGIFEVVPGEYEGVMEFQGCTRTVDTIEIFDYTPLAIPVAQMTGNSQDPNEYQIIASGGRRFDREPFYSFSFTILEEGTTLEELVPSDFTELDGNIFTIRETADYVLRVVDADGCEVLTVQNITYINIRIPNYFTPDSPNTSIEERFWYPRQITPNLDDPFFFENMEVMVFDRYGRMLAEFKGDQQGWDGLYQGKQLPSGDYWYTIILNDIDNREFTGHFTLYR
ncbi:T9SS type B sorting domain-containing protein [Aquimarina muelleri]|nr:T9SS type B sorting domain-containing protein [Aquimarina muelleri]MCX2764216.1 T9SS type B sorting domain-containing protein [Aquimarina muelleri]